MQLTELEVGVIFYPSIRAISYLDCFYKLGICPAKILIVSNDIESLGISRTIYEEFKKHNYSNYFSLENYKILLQNKTEVVPTNSVNSELVFEKIQQSDIDNWIFTGGGILDKKFFINNKKYIHIHPGKIPEFRGSTCFYYSILEQHTIASSAIFLSDKIDKGNIISIKEYDFNFKLEKDQINFLDYILDSYLRMIHLSDILKVMKEGKKISSVTQEIDNYENYYTIHPILRALTIYKINKAYNPACAEGLFLK